jgi:hypothetical protein
MLRTQKHRPSQNDTSGIAGTDSTVLATPILNGRRGLHEGNGAGGRGGGKKTDNGRHLFIHYSASDSGSSPIMEKKQPQPDQQKDQQQQEDSLSNCSL